MCNVTEHLSGMVLPPSSSLFSESGYSEEFLKFLHSTVNSSEARWLTHSSVFHIVADTLNKAGYKRYAGAKAFSQAQLSGLYYYHSYRLNYRGVS